MSDPAASDPEQATAVDKTPHSEKPPAKKGGPLRIILIVVMLVMFGLLGYDRYARSASHTAFEKVKEWVEQNKQASPEEVHELLGRKPDDGLVEKDHYWEETYSWRAGSLYKSYFLTVYYENRDDEPSLYEFVFNQEPTSNDIPNAPAPEMAEENGKADGDESPPADGDEATDGEPPAEAENADGSEA